MLRLAAGSCPVTADPGANPAGRVHADAGHERRDLRAFDVEPRALPASHEPRAAAADSAT
jgi:hypothetical protein